MSMKPHTDESLDHARLVACLPWSSRLSIYAKGFCRAHVQRGWRALPVFAVFPLGMLACAARLAWMIVGDSRVDVDAGLEIGAGVVLIVGFMFAAMFKMLIEHAMLGLDGDEAHWRKWCSLAIAAACLCVLCGPWMDPAGMGRSKQAMLQDYLAVSTRIDKAGGSAEASAEMWNNGEVMEALASCALCKPRLAQLGGGEAFEKPAFAEVMGYAKAANGMEVVGKAGLAMLVAFVMDALCVGVAALALRIAGVCAAACVGVAKLSSRAGASGILRAGGRAGLSAARAPVRLLGWLSWQVEGAKRDAIAAMLSDPRERARYERRAVDDASGKASCKAKSEARL